jgi:hypothetical protein
MESIKASRARLSYELAEDAFFIDLVTKDVSANPVVSKEDVVRYKLSDAAISSLREFFVKGDPRDNERVARLKSAIEKLVEAL